MTEEKIKDGDIVEIDYIEEFTKERRNEGKALVLWKGFNDQPLIMRLGREDYSPIWACYEHISKVVGHIPIGDILKEQAEGRNDMTREEIEKAIALIKRNADGYYPQMTRALNIAIKALEQELCEDWCDVPSNEMTLEQARQAVKDLRKKLAEHLDKEPCEDHISFPKGAIKMCGEGYVVYNYDWFKENWQLELKILGIDWKKQMQEPALDRIRAEIKAKIVKRPWLDFEDRERDRNDAFLEVLEIIDKYRERSERV